MVEYTREGRFVVCKVCGEKYPSVAEDDYTDCCSICEDLSLEEQEKIRVERDLRGLI